MQLQLEIAFIGLIQSVVVAVIAGMFAVDSRKRKKAQESADMSAALRAKESLLAIKLMSASVSLGIATAMAIKDGKTNGAMNSALKDAADAEAAYQDFLKTIAAKQIADGKA